ncbi:MAG: hypothetical protein GX107_03235 [Clostridiales bacterium]|jgi:hypothetical protein|nr:hypothetical protein [Clostridiales bacterium]
MKHAVLKSTLSSIWGLLGGAAGFFFLRRIVAGVLSHEKTNILSIMAFVFLPFAVLIPVAFTAPSEILLCGSFFAGVIIISAVISFLRGINKTN